MISISSLEKSNPLTEIPFSKPSLIFNESSFSFIESLSPDFNTRAKELSFLSIDFVRVLLL